MSSDAAPNPSLFRRFVSGEVSFVPGLLPQDALSLPIGDVLSALRRRFGSAVDEALAAENVDPDAPAFYPGGAVGATRGTSPGGSGWILESNVVGINVRTVGSFAGVLKYCLTLPAAQDAIHLLPFWEPGVVGSLYGMSSWEINPEFVSTEWEEAVPHLDTPGRQLKALVNLLHTAGRKVGLDVIPHTDRFSEIVLSNPGHFEWLRRRDKRIVDHRAELHEEVEQIVHSWLEENGTSPVPTEGLFDDAFGEAQRNLLLFGPPEDAAGRRHRRGLLAREVYEKGYEPVPATMGPPYRGLEVDPQTAYRDATGHVWRDYRVQKPEPMSRVFGPLTRYKLYERLDDNRDWRIDFAGPRTRVWEYVCRRYAGVQKSYGFDFMRGDMSHVQMRPGGVPPKTGRYYDLLGAVKAHIQAENDAPGFAYFAETFLSPPDVMAYGNEIDHLEAAGADATLGDLQSVSVGSNAFLQRLRWYLDIGATRRVVPAFTVMTGDKDDPRFDEFYLEGNEVRYMMALFLRGTPSYMALNFEVRDPHPRPAANEDYTKLYVFQESDGPKATRGPFRFGRNQFLFDGITRIRLFHEESLGVNPARRLTVRWLLPPDATAGQRYLAWALEPESREEGKPARWIVVVNTGTKGPAGPFRVPLPDPGSLRLAFSTYETRHTVISEDVVSYLHIDFLAPGEGRVYEME